MGNKQSKNRKNKEIAGKNGDKKRRKKAKTKRRASLSSRIRTSLSSSNVHNTKSEYTYSEILKLIEDELTNYVPIDLCRLILLFIPRWTIGDESNPINPYDVLNVHVHIISPYQKIPNRVLSIFNLLSPNCHCGAVLLYIQYEEVIYHQDEKLNEKQLKTMKCCRCNQYLGINTNATNCYNSYFQCPSINIDKHYNGYKICEQCVYENIQIYQENESLFAGYYEPKTSVSGSFDVTKSFSTLKTQRRICLAFTEDYVRVYLHCFRFPSNNSHNDFCKALYTSNYEWRLKKNNYALNETQIGVLMDDFCDTNWEKTGKYWTDYMEVWSGGNHDSIFTALCHCNQINNKITHIHKDKIEKYLYNKKMQKHGNVHDVGFDENRKPWTNLSPKLFQSSITENEDTISAVLDIVGQFLSNLTDEQKLRLTYRGKFNKTKK